MAPPPPMRIRAQLGAEAEALRLEGESLSVEGAITLALGAEPALVA